MFDCYGAPVPPGMRRQIAEATDMMGSLEAAMRAKRGSFEALIRRRGVADKTLEQAKLEVVAAVEVLLDAQQHQMTLLLDATYPNRGREDA